MANAQIWSNVAIAIQSAIGSAQAISGITKANPGVATYAGTDPANGDYLYLSSVLGMTQVDDRIIRAANVNAGANTLELEGENTTSFDTFTSGNLQVVTLGTSLSIVTDLNVSGGEFEQIDVTTVHDAVRKSIPGAASAIRIAGSCLWDPSDAGFAALKSLSDIKAKRAFRITFPSGYKALFTGYIGFTGAPTGSGQDKAVTPFDITAFGRMTYYTT